ncbi:MAG TPA: cysteine peptidase family C39 domain-containing protein [Trueperaceae bacterium]|nr:cysteine peptidase family C39 domain-containing protein [Trueperaceae bacterium]
MSRFHLAARRLRTSPALAGLALIALLLPSAVGMAASAAWNDAVHVVPGLEATRQSLPSSCGPALIATLATWQGHAVSEAAVIAQADLGEDGVSLAEFARLASLHALDGTWYRVAKERLGSLPTPFVVHLEVAQGGHFVAVLAHGADKVVVVDPAVGVLVGPAANLLRSFSGRVFVLKNRPS